MQKKEYEAENLYKTDVLHKFLNENLPVGMIGNYLEAGMPFYMINQFMLDSLGYDTQEAYIKSVEGMLINGIHPQEQPLVEEIMGKQRLSSEGYFVTYRMKKKDGSYIWIEDRGKQILDKDGRYIVMRICLDVTSLVQAKEQLEEEKKQLDNIVNSISGGVALYRVGEKIETLYFSDGIPELSGYTKAEYELLVQKEDAADLIYQGDKERVMTAIKNALFYNTDIDITFRKQHMNGKVIWVIMHGHKMGELDGSPVIHAVFHNITTENILYDEILNLSERIVHVSDIETREILYANRTAAESAGEKQESYVGKTCYEWFAKRETPCEDCMLNEIKKRGYYETEYNWAADGPVYYAKGQTVKWRGREVFVEFITDITETKRAEKKAEQEHQILSVRYAEAERDLEDLAGNYLHVLKIHLNNGNVEDAVDNVHGMLPFSLGMSLEEVCEKFCELIESRDTQQEFLNWFQKSHLIEEFELGNYHLEFDAGMHIWEDALTWVRIQVTMRAHPDTREPIVFICQKDITKEKLTEETLFRVVKQGFDFVARLDAKNGNYRMYSSAEKSTIAIEGNYEEQAAKMIERFVAEEESEQMKREVLLSNLSKQLADMPIYKMLIPIYYGQEKRQKVLQFSYIDEEHKIILITCEDVTDMVSMEREHNDKLEAALIEAKKANKAKGEFLARMSHEMRTPMNAIIGLTTLAQDEIKQPEVMMEYLKKIDSSSRLLLSLINDILDMAKIENKKIELNLEPYMFQEFSSEIDMMIRPLCRKKGISFQIEGKNINYQCMLVDRIRIKQIFLNLLSNAVKFTPVQGQIRLSVEEMGKQDDILYCRFTVEDNGIGMNKEFLDRMFDPFVQEIRTESRYEEGSGLGLTISKNLVELMGGTIFARSILNEGTIFTVELGFHTCSPKKYEEEANQEESLKILTGKRILLCEDHPLNAQIATNLLKKKGILVEWAENGRRGLDMFYDSKEGYYDAILMDIRMPEMDGIEASVRIRSLSRTDACKIPILAMTANAYDDDREISKEAGMDAHLTKPMDAKVLYGKLAACMKNESC